MSAVRICQLADAACSMGCSEFECRHGRPARRSVAPEEDAALRRAALRAGKIVDKGRLGGDTMRDAFEAWDCQEFCIDVEDYKQVNGVYLDAPIRNRWLTWQAAQSQPAPPVPSSVQEIMRLMMPYVRACVAFKREEFEAADADCAKALKPLQAALTALVDDNHRLKFDLDGVNAMRPMPNMDAMQAIYAKAWSRAADWANRHDLHSDVGSPAYLKDMANDLTEFADAALGGINAMRGSDWVNIDAEPPPKRIEILVWNGKKRRIGIIAAENGRMMDAKTNQVLYPAPTHWMPMPPPPTHGIEPEQRGNHG